MLSDAELKYIDRRTGLIRIWRYVGLAVLVVLVVFLYAAFANERKLLAISQKLRDKKDHG